jgi:hypothetical protein
METPDGVQNKFYKRPDEETAADQMWDQFKAQWKLEDK